MSYNYIVPSKIVLLIDCLNTYSLIVATQVTNVAHDPFVYVLVYKS